MVTYFKGRPTWVFLKEKKKQCCTLGHQIYFRMFTFDPHAHMKSERANRYYLSIDDTMSVDISKLHCSVLI